MNFKYTLLLIALFTLPSLTYSQYIKIPDARFEEALIDLGIDTDGEINGLVKKDDVILVEILDLSGREIVDLTGIEGFMSLKKLDVSDNEIQRLYLENLYFLRELNCKNNPLEILRISKYAELQSFLYTNEAIPGDLAVVKF